MENTTQDTTGLLWYAVVTGNGQRLVKRNIEKAELERLIERGQAFPSWGPEPMPENMQHRFAVEQGQ